MSERHIEQEIEAVESTVDVEFSKADLMQRFEIRSENTLRRWCEVTGVNWSSKFTPNDVCKLQHLAYHVREQGMTMKDYETMIGGVSVGVTPNETHGRYSTTQEESEQGSAIASIVQQRYQETINKMAKPLAVAFWESLDSAVLREVALIAESNHIPSRLETNILPCFENHSPLWLFPPGEV